jgi:hypothetical protein
VKSVRSTLYLEISCHVFYGIWTVRISLTDDPSPSRS